MTTKPKCPADQREFTHDDPGCDAEVTIEAVYIDGQSVYMLLSDAVLQALYDAALAWMEGECESALCDAAANDFDDRWLA